MSSLSPQSDRVDNVLLELIVALQLRNEAHCALQAILPVLIGPANAPKPSGDKASHPRTTSTSSLRQGFAPFPYHKLARLSDQPSAKTNAVAAKILKSLGVEQDKIDAILKRSVKKTRELVLRNQGIHACDYNVGSSAFGASSGEAFVQACAAKVLRTVQVPPPLYSMCTVYLCVCVCSCMHA